MSTRVVFEPGWQRHIDGDVHDLLERMGAEIETDAKAACPVRDVPYAGYVEEGTCYLAAKPFLRPSLFGVRSL